MKLCVEKAGKSVFRLFVSNRILISRPILRKIKQNGRKCFEGLTRADTRLLRQTVRQMKEKYPDWVLVDVITAEGDRIQVRL